MRVDPTRAAAARANLRRAVVGVVLAPALVVGTVALAQPPGGGARAGAARAAVSTAGSASSAAAPASGAPAGSPADAGPVPAPAGGGGDGAARLSPLNPAPSELSDAGLPAASIDYDRLLADIASLRARAAALGDALFHSRLAVSLQTSGDHGRIAAVRVALDDGTVWTSPPQFRAEDATTVYEHAVAPGRHAVTIDVDRRDDRDDTFRSSQRTRLLVDVPADARLSLDVKLWDDSDMGGSFPADKKGQYDLRVRAQARAQPLAQAK